MSPTRRSGLSPTWGNTTLHEKDGRLIRQQSCTRWALPSFLEGVWSSVRMQGNPLRASVYPPLGHCREEVRSGVQEGIFLH